MIYLGEVCVFFPTSLIIFQSFRFICDLVKEDLTPPVAYYTLSTQYFKIVVLILRLFCSLCVAPNIQRTKVHVLYMCLCVCAKPQGETRLVRGKIKRTHQGLPWCNRGLFFWALKASPWPAGWIEPWTHSATSCTSLSPFLSLSCLFPPLSFLKCTSLQLSHPWLPHRGTSVRAAAKWPALCFILLVVRFCFCLWRFDFRSQSPGGLRSPGDGHTHAHTLSHIHLHRAEEFCSETSGIFSSFCQSHDVIMRRHNASSLSPPQTHTPSTLHRHTYTTWSVAIEAKAQVKTGTGGKN